MDRLWPKSNTSLLPIRNVETSPRNDFIVSHAAIPTNRDNKESESAEKRTFRRICLNVFRKNTHPMQKKIERMIKINGNRDKETIFDARIQ
jgi:hypothetical protein